MPYLRSFPQRNYRNPQMSKRKTGDIFICMEHSENCALAQPGRLLGVFQPREYLVVIPGGYIIIETPEDGDPSDISDKNNRFHTYESDSWRPKYKTGDFQDIDEDDLMFIIIKVNYKFIAANAPRSVKDMIFCTLGALGKMGIETTTN